LAGENSPRSPSARDGHQFESPQLHQEVRANGDGFHSCEIISTAYEVMRIVSGPFADTLCRLEDLDDRGRVRVLLEIMGMEVAAQLERSAIAPAA
jgi:hypothetical protein